MTSIIFSIALFCSVIYIKAMLQVWTSDRRIDKNWLNNHENFALVTLVITCILWGIFYYLSH